jgi:DNA-binding FadR family transcriptional regulator
MYQPISSTRAYETIVERIERLISSKQIKVGEQLPAERELAERFAAASLTSGAAVGPM